MTLPAGILSLDERVRARSRLSSLATDGTVRIIELALLLVVGAIAASLLTFVHFRLRIPGHAIIYSVFPMAFGFALVPRRRAGTTMGLGALGAVSVFSTAGVQVPGVGALTSLLLTGPMLDAAIWLGGRGRRLYFAFVAAGAASNVVAFLLRGGAKGLRLTGPAGQRPFADWLHQAVVTYPLAGLIAGGVSAAVWFHFRRATGSG